MDLDIKYIRISIFLLKKIIGTTFPNPPVISLIVESNQNKTNSKIVGFGFTNIGGRPHAEANALEGIKFKKNLNYTLYSTLEPCCHFGRDESCVSKILKSKINKVVYSLKDPDRRVNGFGENQLKKNGLKVVGGVMSEKTRSIYDGYIINRKLDRPKVTLKIGCSLDSKIANKPNQTDKITNRLVKKIVHIFRSEADAILVGSNTVNIDDPQLNCRIKGLKNFSPIRVILSKKLDFNLNSKIFKNCISNPTIIFTLKTKSEKIDKINQKNAKVFLLDRSEFKLSHITKELAKLGVCNLFVEGGGKIFTSFINEDLVDRIILFRSSFFIGSQGVNVVKNIYKKDKTRFTLKHFSILKNNTMEILEKQVK